MTRKGAIGNLIHAIRWNDMPKKEALDMAIQALQAQTEKTCDTCKHSGKNQYTDEPCSECDECMLWEQAQAENKCNPNDCPHPYGTYKTCIKCKEDGNNGMLYRQQNPSRDMKEIEEVINCDADSETKCKMISNILTAKPHYFEKQEPKTEFWWNVIGGQREDL